ncbi:hypothetical protein D9758_003740 [Tetrapyrgos nigripes]|uniref:Putative gamma-glutamylcyclotransferase n=1 Tax=Tetrapyrgos nigripes TaxID=182062 RepID=A0A8H5LS43_9AGAR|nr:hypothetical protein D9758_003740 [Tetrapyrgos nigripes]
MASAFFYGTLMHPKILLTVINNDGKHLRITPAILLNYTRHRVKRCEYPGIVPFERGRKLFDRELDQDERSVRGTLVTGLTEGDLDYLDQFEGSEYNRVRVDVHPLGELLDISNHSIEDDSTYLPPVPPPIRNPDDLSRPVQADTYVYIDSFNLEPKLWSFEDFVRHNAWRWHGKEAGRNPDIAEIDRRKAQSAQNGSASPSPLV